MGSSSRNAALVFVVAGALGCVSDDTPSVLRPAVEAGVSCVLGEKVCGGRCVRIDDPLYGCGPSECAPCAEAPFSVSRVCADGVCKVEACTQGRDDCNQLYADGCEADLASPETCGSCSLRCMQPEGVCSQSDAGSRCTPRCTNGQSDCNGQCIDTQSSLLHCGGCGKQCSPPMRGFASCSGGSCKQACAAGLVFAPTTYTCEASSNVCLSSPTSCIYNQQCCSQQCGPDGKCLTCKVSGETCSSTAGDACCLGRSCVAGMCQ